LEHVRKICALKTEAEVTALIADPEFQKSFVEEYKARGPSHGAGLTSQTVIGVGDNEDLKRYLDRSLADIGKEEGRHPIEVMLDLALRSRLALQLKSGQVTATDPTQGARLMSHAGVVLGGGADGGAHTKSFGTGHYATDLLIWYVREAKLKTLEDMHFQLALKGARSVQIFDRGAILPGYWADILIYDLDELWFDQRRYEILHDMPNGDWRRKGRAGGYDTILVNGVVTHRKDVPTGATPGQFVRVCPDRSKSLAAE
jgi:N-acyl-D-aspartate/D-glutamate deacylase